MRDQLYVNKVILSVVKLLFGTCHVLSTTPSPSTLGWCILDGTGRVGFFFKEANKIFRQIFQWCQQKMNSSEFIFQRLRKKI